MGIQVWRLRGADAAARRPAAVVAQVPTPGSAPSPPAPGPIAAAASGTTPKARPGAPPPPADSPSSPASGGDESPPWTDADLAGLPADEPHAPSPLQAEPAAGQPAGNPVAAMDWPALEQAVAGCRACGLCERRNSTVFGVGDRNADVMFIGEGPGADEDRKGEPFVGRAGQLLNRMLAAAGFARAQVYIANIVKCRPPNNRDPSGDEATACRAYLERQIALVQPRLIVCLGRVPAHNLLGTAESIGRLRGRLHQYGAARIPLLVTYHPSYYLRSPEQKAKGWQDLQRMLELLAPPAAATP
jgi:DNA polymerase